MKKKYLVAYLLMVALPAGANPFFAKNATPPAGKTTKASAAAPAQATAARNAKLPPLPLPALPSPPLPATGPSAAIAVSKPEVKAQRYQWLGFINDQIVLKDLTSGSVTLVQEGSQVDACRATATGLDCTPPAEKPLEKGGRAIKAIAKNGKDQPLTALPAHAAPQKGVETVKNAAAAKEMAAEPRSALRQDETRALVLQRQEKVVPAAAVAKTAAAPVPQRHVTATLPTAAAPVAAVKTATTAHAVPAAVKPERLLVQRITPTRDGFAVQTSQPIGTYRIMRLSAPARIAVDIDGIKFTARVPRFQRGIDKVMSVRQGDHGEWGRVVARYRGINPPQATVSVDGTSLLLTTTTGAQLQQKHP